MVQRPVGLLLGTDLLLSQIRVRRRASGDSDGSEKHQIVLACSRVATIISILGGCFSKMRSLLLLSLFAQTHAILRYLTTCFTGVGHFVPSSLVFKIKVSFY